MSIVLKALRIIGLTLVVMFLLLCVMYFYFNSDLFRVHQLKEKIEADFKLSLKNSPKLIDVKNYGWAEESGDVALLQVNSSDCLALSKNMTDSDDVSDDSYDGNDIFKKNNLTPKNLKVLFQSTNDGDFVQYKLEIDSCVLYVWSHSE